MEGARPALPGDLAACARLLAELRDRTAELRGGPEILASCRLPEPPAPVDESWLTHNWTGPDRLLLAGTVAGIVVGVGAGHLRESRTERVGAIDCCYVEIGARGVGVGTAIAESLVQWFSESGCVAVDAPALPGDRSTKQLFESLGLSARLLVLHRRLP